jgi:predicted DNA-binding protein
MKPVRLASITVTPEQKEFLDNEARNTGYSKSTLIRLMIDAEIKKRKEQDLLRLKQGA